MALRPTAAAGAAAQRPMQGAGRTRAPGISAASKAAAPAFAQGHAVAHAHGGSGERLVDIEMSVEGRDHPRLRSATGAGLRRARRDGPSTGPRSGPGSGAECSISRSRRRGLSPSSAAISARAPSSTWRPRSKRRPLPPRPGCRRSLAGAFSATPASPRCGVRRGKAAHGPVRSGDSPSRAPVRRRR